MGAIKLPRLFVLPPELTRLYGNNVEIRLPEGDEGTRATMQVIRAIIHDSDRRGLVQQLAQKIALEIPQLADNRARKINMARYLYYWLSEHVTFMPDTFGKEQLRHVNQPAWELLDTGRTVIDCEDLAQLGCAIARCWGFKTALCVAGRDPTGPYEHAYFALEIGGQPVPLDPQMKTPLGYHPQAARKLLLWVE